MKRQFLTTVTIIFLSGLVQAQTFKDDKSACRPLRLACQSAGFALNDSRAGNKLIKDCIAKLAIGQNAVSPVTGRVASAPANADIKACAGKVHKGPKPTAGLKSKNKVSVPRSAYLVK